MSLKIRRATKEDSKTIEELLKVLYRPEMMWTQEKTEKRMEEGKEYYLLINQEAVGALELEGNELTALGIKEERKGYGKMLVEFGEDLIKSRGYDSAYLYTLEANKARGFHEKMGFKLEETIPNLVDDQTGYKYSKVFK